MPQENQRGVPVVRADITRCSGLNTARNAWLVEIPRNHTEEDVQKAAYWAHFATKLTARDYVECWWEDKTRYLVLRVIGLTRGSVSMFLESRHDLADALNRAAIDSDIADYDVSFVGPEGKFRIVRKSDRTFVQDGFETQEAAMWWLVLKYLAPKLSAAETGKKAT